MLASQSRLQSDELSLRFLAYVREGGNDELEQILTTCARHAYTHAFRLLGEQADSQDAVQEAFIQLIRSKNRYDGSVRFQAWLGRLVHDSALKVRRSRSRRQQLVLKAARNIPGNDPVPPDNEQSSVMHGQLREAIDSLPEKYRSAVSLHYFAGLDHQQAAQALKISVNSLTVRLHRGRDRLRALLERRGQLAASTALLALLTTPLVLAEADVPARIAHLCQSAAGGFPQQTIIHQSFLTKVLGIMRQHPLISALSIAACVVVAAGLIAAENMPGPKKDVGSFSISSLKLKWAAPIGQRPLIASSPIDADQVVLYPTASRLTAVNKNNGEIAWKIDGPFERSLPAYKDDTVIVLHRRGVQALDARTGASRWSVDLVAKSAMAENAEFECDASVAIADDRIYVVVPANPVANVVCLSVKDGNVQWMRSGKDLVTLDNMVSVGTGTDAMTPATSGWLSMPVPASDGRLLISEAVETRLWCLRRSDGSAQWDISSDLSARPTARDETRAYALGSSSMSAIDLADGHVAWQFSLPLETGDGSDLFDQTHWLVGDPLVVGNVVVIGTDRCLQGIDRKHGTLAWTVDVPNNQALRFAADTEGIVYARTDINTLLAIRATDGAILISADLAKADRDHRALDPGIPVTASRPLLPGCPLVTDRTLYVQLPSGWGAAFAIESP
jgi:RNA polymerase sigma-70 factor, ECF subfamily